MADAEKRARAHFVVDTSRGFDAARAQVRDIVAELTAAGLARARLTAAGERAMKG